MFGTASKIYRWQFGISIGYDKRDGNVDHWVYYSSGAISNATGIAAEITGLSGSVGYGFGKKRVNVKYVYE